MDVPEDILEKGDVARSHVREHSKALLGNILGCFLTILTVILAIVFLPASLYPWAHWAIAITGAILIILIFMHPVIQWSTSTYTITDKRLIARSGVVKKSITEISRSAIREAEVESDVVDQLFDSGALIVELDDGRKVTFRHVPAVDDFRALLMAEPEQES